MRCARLCASLWVAIPTKLRGTFLSPGAVPRHQKLGRPGCGRLFVLGGAPRRTKNLERTTVHFLVGQPVLQPSIIYPYPGRRCNARDSNLLSDLIPVRTDAGPAKETACSCATYVCCQGAAAVRGIQ